MQYLQLHPRIHLFYQPIDRKKAEMEILYSAGGSLFESENHRGRKHLMEHCIASRTRTMDFHEFNDYQFKEDIYLNAYTGPLTMGLNASGHYTDFQKMLEILVEMALNPTFDQFILDQEKEVVLREISERSGDPAYRLHFLGMKEIYEEHTYEVHEVLGNPIQVALTSLEDMYLLHKQNLENSHLFINISGGGLDIEAVEKVVKRELELLPDPAVMTGQSKFPITYAGDHTMQDFKYKPIVSDLGHDHADMGIYLPATYSFENKPVVKIFEDLFLKFHGILHEKLRNELGLIYGMSSNFDFYTQMLYLNMASEIENVARIWAVVQEVFSDFDKFYRPQKLVEFKNILKKKVELSKDTLGQPNEFAISTWRMFGEWENYDEFLLRLDAVTDEDMRNLYEEIKAGISKSKVTVVSNNPDIKNIF